MSTTSTPVYDGHLVPYPDVLAARYRAGGAWGPRTIAEEFSAVATEHPDRVALAAVGESFTYAELDRTTDRIALGLQDLGLRPGERILLQITNCSWAVLAWYGILKAGLVPVATLAQHRRHEIADVVAQTEPTAHLVQADFRGHDLVALAHEIAADQPSVRRLLTLNAESQDDGATAIEALLHAGSGDATADRRAVQEIQNGISSEDLAVMQLSGGTTSVPKVIPRLHGEYWFNAHAYAKAIDLDEESGVAHLLPVVHNAGIVCGVHAAHSVGACFALCPHGAEEMKTLAMQVRLTHMMTPPPIAQLILADPELRSALGTLTSAIWVLGRLNDAAIDSFETDTCRIVQMFGMGEGLCLVTPRDAPKALRHRAVGTTISELDEIRVLEPGTETEVPAGSAGELCCRGPYTIRGYYRSPQRNAEAFTADGFYRTGDIVTSVEHEGTWYYVLEDRIKDLINRGGEKINALEVEQLLDRHPAVERTALVAMPDDRLGERACVFVVPARGAEVPSVEEFQRYLHGLGVAKFKSPERVEEIDSMPLTNVDKLDKARLRRTIVAQLEAEVAA